MLKPFVFLAPCLALLAACSDVPSSETVLRDHGYSDPYVRGYHDGCESGKHDGGDSFARRTRDGAAYGSDQDYKHGWDYAFVTCREQEIRDLQVAKAVGIVAAAAMSSSSHGADGIDARQALRGIDTSAIQAAGW